MANGSTPQNKALQFAGSQVNTAFNPLSNIFGGSNPLTGLANKLNLPSLDPGIGHKMALLGGTGTPMGGAAQAAGLHPGGLSGALMMNPMTFFAPALIAAAIKNLTAPTRQYGREADEMHEYAMRSALAGSPQAHGQFERAVDWGLRARRADQPVNPVLKSAIEPYRLFDGPQGAEAQVVRRDPQGRPIRERRWGRVGKQVDAFLPPTAPGAAISDLMKASSQALGVSAFPAQPPRVRDPQRGGGGGGGAGAT